MNSAFPLSPQQKQAVESQDPALLILAGPGTGKTRVLIERIFHFVHSGIPANRILAVTFSRKATKEMLDRLEDRDPEIADQIEVSTLHAFCIDLVQRHGFRLGLGRRLKLMSGAQSYLFLKDLAPKLPLEKLAKTSFIEPMINDLLGFFQDCKDEGLWPEDVISFALSLPEADEDEQKIKEEWLALGDIYNSFQNHCFEQGYLDFGDAVLGAVRLLEEHPLVKQEVQDSFDAILVDEFQDTNWTQSRLLSLISKKDSFVTVVGDDDQAIYRFRGASFSAFRFFQEMFDPIQVVELTETYRLPTSVAEVATALIKANGEHRYRPDKTLVSKSAERNPVQIIKAQNYEQEAQWVANKIKSLLDEGVACSEIGVLFRSYNHADLLFQELSKREIPVFSPISEALFEHEVIEDVLSFLRLLIDPKDNIALLRLFDSPFLRLEADDIFSFCQWNDFNRSLYMNQLEKIEESPLSDEAKNRLSQFYKTFKTLFKAAQKKPCSEILFRFFEETDAVAYLMKQQPEALEPLAQFLNRLVEWESVQLKRQVANLFPLLEAISQREVQLSKDENEDTGGEAVRLLTAHASKGLEFEHVFVLSLVGRRFPSNFRKNTWMLPNAARKEEAPTKESHVFEERRLFYVAATRAKKNLYLTGIEKKGTKLSKFLSVDIPAHLTHDSFLTTKDLPALEGQDAFVSQLKSSFERISTSSKKATRQPKEKESLRLSFTQLDQYETCPRKYWFSYELRIPAPVSSSLTIGSAVHEALEYFYKKILQDEKAGKEFLEHAFKEAFERENKIHQNCGGKDFEVGLQALLDYYDLHGGQFKKPLAVEKSFKLRVGEHQVSGKIDRVDEGPEGVVIIDYKTGKAKDATKKEHQKFAEDSLQFSIYALAAKECFDWKLDRLEFYYLYSNQSLATTRSDEQLVKTKERITALADQIQENHFDASPGFHCKFCDYKRICPSAQV